MTKRNEVIQIRVSTEEKAKIKADAELASVKMSDWVRSAALSALEHSPESSWPAPEPTGGNLKTENMPPRSSYPPGFFRCPNECDSTWLPSKQLRCPMCNRQSVAS